MSEGVDTFISIKKAVKSTRIEDKAEIIRPFKKYFKVVIFIALS